MDYRLSAALLCSLLLHAVLLGVGPSHFPVSPTKTKPSPLEIILASKEPPKIVQKPDRSVPGDTVRNKVVEERPQPKANPSSRPEPQQAQAKSAIDPLPSPEPLAKKKPPAPKTESPTSMPTAVPQPQGTALHPTRTDRPTPQPALSETSGKASAKPLPSARALIAALEERLAEQVQYYNFRPSKRYISSSTRGYAAMAYLDSWCKKIERVGRLNYPAEAKRQGLSGNLVLMVNLYPDGTVANIIVRQSSGYQALDEAAVGIVRLAAPFAKVPGEVLQGHDMLSITRTWHFRSDKDFSSN